MAKCVLFLQILLLLFIAADCRKSPNPVGPPPGADTTSNNFTWTQYTFGGQGGSSYFKDVAIVNDSDIWAVGSIYTSPDTMYNAAHWDGVKWSLLQIPFYTICGQSHITPYPINTVFAYSGDDICFSDGGEVVHWVDSSYDHGCSVGSIINGAINKIWGTSSVDLYAVGNAGTIIRYSNGTWTQMPSGTTIDLRDVWGTPDGGVVWACGYSNDNSQSILLKYDGTQWKTIWSRQNGYTPPYGDLVSSVWSSDSLYITSNYGIFRDNTADGSGGKKQSAALQYFPHSIRGTGENNIVEVGDNGEIWHYTGDNWKQVHAPVSTQVLNTVAVYNDLVVAGGIDFAVFPGQALIYIGRH